MQATLGFCILKELLFGTTVSLFNYQLSGGVTKRSTDKIIQDTRSQHLKQQQRNKWRANGKKKEKYRERIATQSAFC